jgi:hypothetical protein
MRYPAPQLVLLALGAVALAGALPAQIHAQVANCKARAAEKKLAGAALASFTKKCQADAANACNVSAGAKKLSGAAKTSFTAKCVRDKVGG